MTKNIKTVGQKEDKMIRPKEGVRPFNFPAFGVTLHAENIYEAQKELKKHLDSLDTNKQKND